MSLLVRPALALIVLLLLEVLDRVFEEAKLVFIINVHVLFHYLISNLKFLHIVQNSLFEAHGLSTSLSVTFHKFVDLDTLERSILFYILFKGCISTTDSDHDAIIFD